MIITPIDIMAFIARSARISLDDMRGRLKPRHYVRARAVFAMVMRERGASFTQIGKLLHKDHSTIVHAVHTFEERYANDETAKEMLDYARHEFLEPA